MDNTLEQEFQKYFIQLNEAEKKSVLELLKTFLNGRKQNNGRISIEQYNRELEKAEKEIEKGNFTTQQDLENEMSKW